MQTINRFLVNLCVTNLPETKAFYTSLFDFTVAFESDWFIQLTSADIGLELGIIDRNNDLVPPEYRALPNGFYLTLVIEDVDTVFENAQSAGFEIVQKPIDTAYGQRRLLLKDPAGTLVDISAPIPNFTFGG